MVVFRKYVRGREYTAQFILCISSILDGASWLPLPRRHITFTGIQMAPESIGRGGETKNPCAFRAGNRKESNKACDCVDFERQVL